MTSYDAALEAKLVEAQATWRAPSVSAAVVREGELVWSSAVGTAKVGELEATPDVGYRIGSISKTFTAVLIHQLRDEGRLDLDDTLGTHLGPNRHSGLTLRRLLSHTSGLQREAGDQWITLSQPDLHAELEAAEAVLPPRTAHHYSNLGYALLGAVVAKVTGGTWEAALQSRLLDPLGLTRTSLAPTAPHAQGYLVDPYADAVREEPHTDLGSTSAAGQIWSTATDLARWAAFLADPDPAVLSPDTLDAMRSPLVFHDPYGWNLAWGGGLMLWRRGERIHHGHGGAMPGFLAGCYAFRSDLEHAGAVVLTNTGRAADAEGLASELLNAALDADPRPKPMWVPAEVPVDLVPLLGVWWTEGQEVLFEFRGGELTATVRGGPEARRTKFVATGTDAWLAVAGRERGERLKVLRDDQGKVVRLHFAHYAFTREPLTFTEMAQS
ncbi:MAG: beta-lactamase [Frankiales bacterium]|nr:beta-lactamase [Frankiales bacterium]